MRRSSPTGNRLRSLYRRSSPFLEIRWKSRNKTEKTHFCFLPLLGLCRFPYPGGAIHQPQRSDLFPGGLTLILLCFLFGLYFTFFAKDRLPNYYDENRINAVSDGPFRMNLPGVSINNSNWPHIVQAARLWCCCGGIVLGFINLILKTWFPQLLQSVFVIQGILLLFLLGLFIPMYIAAKRFE